MIDRQMIYYSAFFVLGGAAATHFGLGFIEIAVTAIMVSVLDTAGRVVLTRVSGETDR